MAWLGICTKIYKFLIADLAFLRNSEKILRTLAPDCNVEIEDAKNAIAHIYEETDIEWFGLKLKKFLCLGTIISPRHILTTKLCFGAGPNGGPDEWGYWRPTESILSSNIGL